MQDANLDVGINPDSTDINDAKPDDNPNFTIENMLRRDEGLRLKVYWDSEGYPTIGIGHLIVMQKIRDMAQINKILSNQVGRQVTGNPGIIEMEEASKLFQKDLADVQRDVKSHPRVGPVYAKVNINSMPPEIQGPVNPTNAGFTT